MRTWTKVTLGFLGAIVLGAIGSGVWELALRRLALLLLSGIYLAATLGIETFRDRIYLEAAKGFRETASLNLLLAVTLAIIIAGLVTILAAPKLALKVSTPEVLLQVLDGWLAKWRRLIIVPTVVVAALCFALLLETVRIVETNLVISHFQQCMALSAPHLEPHEEKSFRARFAAMRTRRDYLTLLGELEQHAKAGAIALPQLDWSY